MNILIASVHDGLELKFNAAGDSLRSQASHLNPEANQLRKNRTGWVKTTYCHPAAEKQ